MLRSRTVSVFQPRGAVRPSLTERPASCKAALVSRSGGLSARSMGSPNAALVSRCDEAVQSRAGRSESQDTVPQASASEHPRATQLLAALQQLLGIHAQTELGPALDLASGLI